MASMSRSVAVSLCLVLPLLVGCSPPAEPPAVSQAIEIAASKPHPRLILTQSVERELRTRLETDAAAQRYFEALRDDADRLLDVPPNERKQVGRRLLGVSRDVLSRVLRLALVYRLSGEEKYLERAEAEMLAAAGFSDWNPSHYLDVAEMSTALAFGYDWLYDSLPEASRAAIRAAVAEKGFGTYEGRDATNNWNDVCNGGLLMTALAFAEDYPAEAERTLETALRLWPRALETNTPEGGHSEGVGYWAYATSYSISTVASLESACGTDFGLTERFPGLLKGANYYLQMHGPTGNYFNYSDTGRGTPTLAPQTLWFARRLNEPSLLWLQTGFLKSAEISGRFAPLALAWWPETMEIPPPNQHTYQTDGITPVAVHRSSWTDPNASFIGFKGGRGDGPHGHFDIGSFVFESDGVRWALDLGAESYHGLESRGLNLWSREQESDRWTVFRLNNFSHNTLVVNDALQRVDGRSVFTQKTPTSTVMEFASLYAPHLSAASRGVRLLADRRAVIQDEITAGERDAAVRWAILTGATIDLNGPQATLRQDGKSLTLSVLEPEGVTLETYESETPPREYDSPNPGTRMVGFRVSLKPQEAGRLVVLLTPGSVELAEPPSVEPLPAWSE